MAGEAREGAAVIAAVGGRSRVGEVEALGFFWGQSGPFQWGSSRVGEGARRPEIGRASCRERV